MYLLKSIRSFNLICRGIKILNCSYIYSVINYVMTSQWCESMIPVLPSNSQNDVIEIFVLTNLLNAQLRLYHLVCSNSSENEAMSEGISTRWGCIINTNQFLTYQLSAGLTTRVVGATSRICRIIVCAPVDSCIRLLTNRITRIQTRGEVFFMNNFNYKGWKSVLLIIHY